MFKEPKTDSSELWKVFFDDELYAVLIPIGYNIKEDK